MTTISLFPKGEVLNKALAWLGLCWSLSDELSFTYSLPCTHSLVRISPPLLTHTYEQVWSSIGQGFPLLGYWSLDFHPCYLNLTLNITDPVGYKWYTSMSLFQGLTKIYLSLLLMTVWRFLQDGVSEPLLIPKASLVCTDL